MEILIVTDIVLNSVLIGWLWWMWAQESKNLPPYIEMNDTMSFRVNKKTILGNTNKKPFRWIKIK